MEEGVDWMIKITIAHLLPASKQEPKDVWICIIHVVFIVDFFTFFFDNLLAFQNKFFDWRKNRRSAASKTEDERRARNAWYVNWTCKSVHGGFGRSSLLERG